MLSRSIFVDGTQMKVMGFLQHSGPAADQSKMHAVFQGPPGTGKTDLARIWGKAAYVCGVIFAIEIVVTHYERAAFPQPFDCDTITGETSKIDPSSLRTDSVRRESLAGTANIS